MTTPNNNQSSTRSRRPRVASIDTQTKQRPPMTEDARLQNAATVIQAAYRGYQARQDLYGPAMLVSQKWRRLLDYTRAQYIHKMDDRKPLSPTPMSPTTLHTHQESKVRLAWRRAEFLGSQLAKGSSCVSSEEALMLLTEHWLELSDRKHRYGSNLKAYHEYWLRQDTSQNFFYWLDKGEGKDVDLEERPRALLEDQQVRYLQEHERARYAVHVVDGLLYFKEDNRLVHTLPESVHSEDVVDIAKLFPTADPRDDEATRLAKKKMRGMHKFIYVTDHEGTLYIHSKVKGRFHHSSFLGGGSVCAAGAIVVNNGRLLSINPRSGHYRPGLEHFNRLLERLKQSKVDLKNARISYGTSEEDPAVEEKHCCDSSTDNKGATPETHETFAQEPRGAHGSSCDLHYKRNRAIVSSSSPFVPSPSRHSPPSNTMVHFSGSDIVLFVIAAFLPPLAVLLKEGCGSELVISVALSILGFVPGVLYAWWVIYQGREDARTGQRIYQRPGAVPRRSYVIVAGEVPPNGAQPAPGVIHQYPGQPVVLKSPQGDEVQVLSREIQPSEGQGSGNGQQGSGQPSGQPAGGQPAGGQPADGQAAGGQPGGQQVVYVQGQPVAHDPTSTTETTRHVVEENGVKKTIIRTVKKTQRVVEVPAEAKIQDGQTVVVEHTD